MSALLRGFQRLQGAVEVTLQDKPEPALTDRPDAETRGLFHPETSDVIMSKPFGHDRHLDQVLAPFSSIKIATFHGEAFSFSGVNQMSTGAPGISPVFW